MCNKNILSNEEILKRIWDKKAILKKINFNHKLVRVYIKWFWKWKWLESYFNDDEVLKEKFLILKKYLNFYLYKKELKKEDREDDKIFEGKLYVIFNSMSFGVHLWINAKELIQYINIIKISQEDFVEHLNEYNNSNINLIDLIFFEWKDETKILQDLVESLDLITYNDIKNKFEIWDKIKFQEYEWWDIYFWIITSRKFNMYKKKWEYYISWKEDFVWENLLQKII